MRRRLYNRSVLFMCLISLCAFATGQLSRPGSPMPVNYKGAKELKIYEIEVPDEVQAKLEVLRDEKDPLLKQVGSGFSLKIDFNIYETGVWDTLPNGAKIWRAAFKVEEATALSIIFEPYRVNQGVSVYVYDVSQETILGAFTALNNKSNGRFATARLFEQIAVVEVQVPHYLENAGEITLAKITCDVTEISDSKGLKDGYFGRSGFCNDDINCYNDSIYQKLKYSVVRIFDEDGACTGTLINNTAEDGRNYVLTAKHCIGEEAIANTAVFYFDYESPSCDGPDGNTSMTLSGSTIRAKASMIDFVLLELLEEIPLEYHPYYAGWDITDNEPLSGVAIHHPEADVKKIAFENDALTSVTFSTGYVANSHWLVSEWDSGTTEHGSSGCAYFDQNNRLVGELTGGLANCSNPIDDYFQKFSYCWDYYSDHAMQLAYWLDPLEEEPYFIDGYDPYEDLWASGDTLSNIQEDEVLVDEDYGLSWGYLSGHNSSYTNQFAEQFSVGENKSLFGVILNIAHNYVASAASHLVLKVWQNGNEPQEVIYEKDVLLSDLAAGTTNMIRLDSSISLSDGFYVGYELFYAAQQDTFAVWMADNRSLQQTNTSFVYKEAIWYSLNEYTGGAVYSSFDIRPVVYDDVSSTEPEDVSDEGILVYPNPVEDECWIAFQEMTASPVELKLYDLSGRLVYQEVFPPYQTLINLSTRKLMSGVYILQVTANVKTVSYKLVVVAD